MYNREIADLNEAIKVYDVRQRQYITNNFIPAMNTVFTYLAYELLDRFVADLIRAKKFDKEALKYVDLERSNDLLKNINLAKNKLAVIEQSFVACPFNTAVYMTAMKHDYLDYDTFQTAKYFKQGDIILDFLNEQLGTVDYPKYTKGNYYSAVLLGQLTGKSVEEIIKRHTAPYVRAVVNEYQKLIKLIDNPAECQSVVRQWKEDDVLAGEKTTKNFAGSSVRKIVADSTWRSITEEAQISDDIVIDFSYTETNDWDEEVWYEWDMIVRMNMLEDYRQSGNTDDKTMYEIMDNCRVIVAELSGYNL